MQYNDLPLFTIIIPSRNEEKFIKNCLDSIIANNYPEDKLEILVVDGMSEDGTSEIVKNYSRQFSFIKLIENIKKITPSALNIGIKNAKGDYILILSSHSKIYPDFVSKNVYSIKKYLADCVGGIIVTLPNNDTLMAKAISLTVSHYFGVGNSYFRIGTKKPRYVDTVPFGCYKRDIFEKIGLFDEDLIRNQDDEFNFRLIKNGGKILLVPEIVSYYYVRHSLSKLWKMFFQYGYFKPLVSQKIGSVVTWRQLIPSVFVSSLIITGLLSLFGNYFLWPFLLIVILYLSANLGFSLSIAIKDVLKLLPALSISFAVLHFSYGLGYLKGIGDFMVLRKHSGRAIKDMPLTR